MLIPSKRFQKAKDIYLNIYENDKDKLYFLLVFLYEQTIIFKSRNYYFYYFQFPLKNDNNRNLIIDKIIKKIKSDFVFNMTIKFYYKTKSEYEPVYDKFFNILEEYIIKNKLNILIDK